MSQSIRVSTATINELIATIVKLEDALKFYADPTSWAKKLSNPRDPGHHPLHTGSMLKLSDIEIDSGNKAREALKDVSTGT